MTTYNFEIEELPDNLKCAQCKLVLKDACQLPCGCRFCRACIDDLMARGGEFCPGESEDCGQSPLSRFSTDYWANRKVSRLPAKCFHNGCVHVCQLVNMKEHLRECPRKTEECPFRELGCTQDKLAVEEMCGHLQHENRRHNEILIGMIVNINKEIETLKQRDEASSREIETLKHELVLKDEQIRSIMDQMIHVQNENKSIKDKIELEIVKNCENDELDLARVIDHVDREIAVVTGLIETNKNELATQLQSVRGDIGSIKDDICSMKSQVQSTQAIVGLGQVDASCVWLIDDDVAKTRWGWPGIQSEYFSGVVHPYKYRLESWKFDIGTYHAALYIDLRIHAGPNDGQLVWPFEARVIITVRDRDRREVCRSISLQCRIERPPDNECSCSDPFVFRLSELTKAGLNLNRGVRVSCVIVGGTDN